MSDDTTEGVVVPFTSDRDRGRFAPGVSGNPAGKPKGARSRVSAALIEALEADFAEHGAGVIAKVRAEDPTAYLKVIAGLVSKQVEFEDTTRAKGVEEMTREELLWEIRRGQNASDKAQPETRWPGPAAS